MSFLGVRAYTREGRCFVFWEVFFLTTLVDETHFHVAVKPWGMIDEISSGIFIRNVIR